MRCNGWGRTELPARATLGVNTVGAGGQLLTTGHAQAPKLIWEALQHRAKLTAFNHSLHFFYCQFWIKKKKRFILSPHHCCPGKDKTLVLTLADEDCYLSLRHFRKIISFSFFFTPKPLHRATTLEMSVLCWRTVLCQASLHLYLCRVAAWVLGSQWEPRG